jgi:hypothetical protein
MRTLKFWIFIVLIFVLSGCTASRRIISSVHRPIPQNYGILVGRFIVTNTMDKVVVEARKGIAVLPSFSISDLEGKIVTEFDNSSITLKSTKKEIIFFASLPAGSYRLYNYSWTMMPEAEFDQAKAFEIEAQKINYLGDIVAIAEVIDYSYLNLDNTWAYKLNYAIEDNMEAMKPFINEKLSEKDWQIVKNLIH